MNNLPPVILDLIEPANANILSLLGSSCFCIEGKNHIVLFDFDYDLSKNINVTYENVGNLEILGLIQIPKGLGSGSIYHSEFETLEVRYFSNKFKLRTRK